jgi:N-methylhydantoinase B
VLHPGTDRAVKLEATFSDLPAEPGDIVRIETPAGAGFGDPRSRDRARIRDDIADGKVSPAMARQLYGYEA